MIGSGDRRTLTVQDHSTTPDRTRNKALSAQHSGVKCGVTMLRLKKAQRWICCEQVHSLDLVRLSLKSHAGKLGHTVSNTMSSGSFTVILSQPHILLSANWQSITLGKRFHLGTAYVAHDTSRICTCKWMFLRQRLTSTTFL